MCDEDNSAGIYTKDGGYFGISPLDEIKGKDIPKQADAEAILISDSCGYTFWTKGQIRIFVTYEESGLVDTFRIEYGDTPIYDGETELTFEDLYKTEGPEWDTSYQAEITGTVEYQHKQEAARHAQTAGKQAGISLAYMDDMGVARCGDCGAELLCRRTGDMPDTCLHCRRKLEYNFFKEPDGPDADRYRTHTTAQQEAGTAAEAASEGRETALSTPEKMAGTDTTAAADGQQAPPWAQEINLGKLYAITRPKAGGGLRVLKPEPP